MRNLLDSLPPEVAQGIHPDWIKNEAGYRTMRDQLLPQFRDRWIAFADGRVIASALNPVEVFDSTHGQHPFITRVGREDDPWCRMRRTAFPYDSTHVPEPLPVLSVEFRKQPGFAGLIANGVIPDTGADSSSIPWSDCQRLGLDRAAGIPAWMTGIGGITLGTVVFRVWAHLDGNDYHCNLQADFSGSERILGRDVLNQVDVLFRGPGREVVVNP